MRQRRFSEELVIRILREQEVRGKIDKVCPNEKKVGCQ
jgi:hypothetical protein